MGIEQTIRQSQRLQLTQTMQQSLKVLQMDGFSLQEYLNDLSLSNPLVDVSASGDININGFERMNSPEYTNLYDYLETQIELRYSEKPLRRLVSLLARQLDRDGFLNFNQDEFIATNGVSIVEFEDALTLLQSLDPAGVGARSIQESLIIQALQIDICPPLVLEILRNYYHDFLHNDIHRILVGTEASVADFTEAKRVIGTFTSRPGATFWNDETQYRIPDIKVRPDGAGYRIYLTKFGRPELIFNTAEYDQLRAHDDKELEDYLGSLAMQFHDVDGMLQRREETISAVAEAIVAVQWLYLKGEQKFISNLLLRDVARSVGVAESTVSRAISGEYIDSPIGIVAVRDLLTNRSGTSDGESADSRAMSSIRRIIRNEDNSHPLSDQKIAELLAGEGIAIARRTVAKYRGVMGIASKKLRKNGGV